MPDLGCGWGVTIFWDMVILTGNEQSPWCPERSE